MLAHGCPVACTNACSLLYFQWPLACLRVPQAATTAACSPSRNCNLNTTLQLPSSISMTYLHAPMCPVLYNPGGAVLSATQKVGKRNLEYFYRRLLSCHVPTRSRVKPPCTPQCYLQTKKFQHSGSNCQRQNGTIRATRQ